MDNNLLKQRYKSYCLRKNLFKSITYFLNNMDWKNEIATHLNYSLNSEIKSIIITLGIHKPVIKSKFPAYLLNSLSRLGLIKYTDIFAKEYDIHDEEKVTLSSFGLRYFNLLSGKYSIDDIKAVRHYFNHSTDKNIFVLRPTVFKKDKSINVIESINHELNRIMKVIQILAKYSNRSLNKNELDITRRLIIDFYRRQNLFLTPFHSTNTNVFRLAKYQYPTISSFMTFLQTIYLSRNTVWYYSMSDSFPLKLIYILETINELPKPINAKIHLIGRVYHDGNRDEYISNVINYINQHSTKKDFIKLFINHPTHNFKKALSKSNIYKYMIHIINYQMFN